MSDNEPRASAGTPDGVSGRRAGRLAGTAEGALKLLMVLCLAVMSVLVFTNVVLRYGFNSSLVMTEEIARYAFVWMTFLGSILAFSRNRHVRMDLVLNLLRGRAHQLALLVGDLLVLVCCYLIVKGCYELASLNVVNKLPVTGLSVAWLYAAGIPFGIAVALMTIVRLVRRLRGKDHGATQ